MLVNHKIQIFLIILFVSWNVLISIGMEGLVGYARHISNVDSAREGDLRVPKPERPPSRSHPVGHGTRVTSSMCNTIDFCLYAAVFSMECCAEDVPHVTPFWPHRYINTVSPPHYFPQRRTGRNRVRIRPSPNWKTAVELGSVRATLQEGRNYLGCGDRRYFQKSCCLSDAGASSGFLEMVLADSRSPSSFPRRSPARTDSSSTAYVR